MKENASGEPVEIGIIGSNIDSIEMNPYQLPGVFGAALVAVGGIAVHEDIISFVELIVPVVVKDGSLAAEDADEQIGIQCFTAADMWL